MNAIRFRFQYWIWEFQHRTEQSCEVPEQAIHERQRCGQAGGLS